jgi:hypothetical protein
MSTTLLTLITAAATAAMAAPCTVSSPPHRVALVELYTSQGCSSCPPADRWLSTLPQRWDASQAIPLSLHVGYWDYIGWKDPFAQRAFNQRQQLWAQVNGSRSVYTPGVFVHGRELRAWSQAGEMNRAVKQVNEQAAGAQITLAAQITGGRVLAQVDSQPLPGGAAPAHLRLALAQSGLSTAVRAGENRGEQLGNDHVVREWSEPLPLGRQQLSWPVPPGAQPASLALVAFVQAGDGGPVLQAVRWTEQACRR